MSLSSDVRSDNIVPEAPSETICDGLTHRGPDIPSSLARWSRQICKIVEDRPVRIGLAQRPCMIHAACIFRQLQPCSLPASNKMSSISADRSIIQAWGLLVNFGFSRLLRWTSSFFTLSRQQIQCASCQHKPTLVLTEGVLDRNVECTPVSFVNDNFDVAFATVL